MALSKRLFSIFSMVEKGSIVADIGCDHGLLSIALLQEGVAQHVYACDLRKGPLSRATQAIQDAKLQNQITTLLSDGLQLVPSDIDTIVIAGMGQETIQTILEGRIELVTSCKRIIIQANKHMDQMRQWISDHNFTILQEDIVEEDHFYEILCFSCTNHDTYCEEDIVFGTNSSHPLFVAYWQHQYHKLETIVARLPKKNEVYQTYQNRMVQIQNKLKKHSL